MATPPNEAQRPDLLEEADLGWIASYNILPATPEEKLTTLNLLGRTATLAIGSDTDPIHIEMVGSAQREFFSALGIPDDAPIDPRSRNPVEDFVIIQRYLYGERIDVASVYSRRQWRHLLGCTMEEWVTMVPEFREEGYTYNNPDGTPQIP